jgi:hypothetical protein
MKLFPGLNLHYYSPNDPNNPNPGQRSLRRKTDAIANPITPLPPFQHLGEIPDHPLGIPDEYLQTTSTATDTAVPGNAPSPGAYPSARFGSYVTSRARLLRILQKPHVNRDHDNIRIGASILQFLGKQGSIENLSTSLARAFERRHGSPKSKPDWQDDKEITLERVFRLCSNMISASHGKTIVKKENVLKKDALPINSVSLEDLNAVRGKMVMALTNSEGIMIIFGYRKAPENMYAGDLPKPVNEMWLDENGKIKSGDADDISKDDERIIPGQIIGIRLSDDSTLTTATPGKLLMEVWKANRKDLSAGDIKLDVISVEPHAGAQVKGTDEDGSQSGEPSNSKMSPSRKSTASTQFSSEVTAIAYIREEDVDDEQERDIVRSITRDLDVRDDKPAPVRFGTHSGKLSEEISAALANAFPLSHISEESADSSQGDVSHARNMTTDNQNDRHADNLNAVSAASASVTPSLVNALSPVSNTGSLFDDLDGFMDQFSSKK